MTQYSCTGFYACSLFNHFCHFKGITNALCIDDHMVLFANLMTLLYLLDDLLYISIIFLCGKNILRATGNTCP